MVATRAEVAALAGVSPSTVTYVLTGKRPTSPATRDRVHRAVETLGYRPSAAARSLASHSMHTVGVLFRRQRAIIDANDLDYVDGARAALESRGIQVVLPVLSTGALSEEINALVGSRAVDGAILMDVAHQDFRERLLVAGGLPTVLLGFSGAIDGAPWIDADFSEMAACSLRHLVELGHRRIMAVLRHVGSQGSNADHALARGLTEWAEALSITLVVRTVPDDPLAGASLVGAEGLEEGCTAVVAASSSALAGLVSAAHAHGLSIPADLSMVSLGTSETMGGRGITECCVDRVALGRAAGELLALHAAGQARGQPRLMPVRLTDHGSTAARRHDAPARP
ncbi:LacI family DNA-binding transcriptional regulator [Actinomyces slackii]|uniref:Catabolite control protein n=1 Tax=Actinomyces slackii TaxID=52774 RepID=A0A3S4UQ29_9ACTO|nr:LacI family DNA-binding transcriptional regulator [Actinomyces slackii]VEG75669.1 Catabolite control protein [Actinomyces slackii]